MAGNQDRWGGLGADTTKRKLQLFIQRHSQVATVFSKGFYNNIKCRCGTVLCFQRWNYQKVGRCENYVPISPSEACKVMLLWKCFGVIG